MLKLVYSDQPVIIGRIEGASGLIVEDEFVVSGFERNFFWKAVDLKRKNNSIYIIILTKILKIIKQFCIYF